MATQAVLETNELLENIILSLDLKDILRVKTVAKSWNQLIESSIHIQRDLFLVPAKWSAPLELNRQEADAMWPITLYAMVVPLNGKLLRLNPILGDEDDGLELPIKSTWSSCLLPSTNVKEYFRCYVCLLPRLDLCIMPSVMLSMHITQPPVTTVGVHLLLGDNDLEADLVLKDGDGIKFGLLVTVFKQLVVQMLGLDGSDIDEVRGLAFGFRVQEEREVKEQRDEQAKEKAGDERRSDAQAEGVDGHEPENNRPREVGGEKQAEKAQEVRC